MANGLGLLPTDNQGGEMSTIPELMHKNALIEMYRNQEKNCKDEAARRFWRDERRKLEGVRDAIKAEAGDR